MPNRILVRDTTRILAPVEPGVAHLSCLICLALLHFLVV